MMNGRDTMIW